MAKPDFPPLLPPGVHQLSMDDLHRLAVAPFPEDMRRGEAFRLFKSWIEALQALQVGGKIWLDGSFLTEKPNPSDIDCILWSPKWLDRAIVTPEAEQQVKHLLDRSVAENIFMLDFYMEAPAADRIFHREAYWSGVMGFAHDRVTAKGFAEVAL